ncbi:MAG: hypothetical protein ABEH77_08760 [Halobacteriaceae archaeon]
MATETDGEELTPRARHRRSITVTAIAALSGVGAGVASNAVASGATDRVGLAVLGVALGVAFGAMRLAGVDIAGFSKKDIAYVVFMAFSLWFVSWAILLTA